MQRCFWRIQSTRPALVPMPIPMLRATFFLALLTASVACSTVVKPMLNTKSPVALGDWAKSINEIAVESSIEGFFAHSFGITVVDTPMLSRNHEVEIKNAIHQAIIQSGGLLGVEDAPDLHVDVKRCSVSWDSTGFGITSVARVQLAGELVWPDGRAWDIKGGAFVQQISVGVVLASSVEPQLSKALSQVIEKLLTAKPRGTKRARGERSEHAEPKARAGTCFAVSPDGWLVSANHIVNEAEHIEVKFGTVVVSAEVVVRDVEHDLALLRVEVPTPDYLSIMADSRIEIGSEVYTLGYPLPGLLSQDIRFNEGTISAVTAFENAEGLYQISVPTQPGNSGGPLLLTEGEVIGVVVARASDFAVLRESGSLPENISFAIDSDYIHTLLKTAGASSPRNAPLSTRAAAKAVHMLIAK